VRFGSPGLIRGVNDAYQPAVDFFDGFLPLLGLFALGMASTVISLKLFDGALPSLESANDRFQRAADILHHKIPMFLLGVAITVLTVSVAVSLTVLVPLSMKGIVRRRSIIPYVMGAQVGTFVDKLFVTLLLNTPRAFTIIFSEMAAVLTVSLLVLLVAFDPFREAILAVADRATGSRRAFTMFLVVLFVIPVVLIAIPL